MRTGRRPQGTGHRETQEPGSGRAEASTPLTGSAAGRLFVVATPIGNLADLSPRAREVLSGVRWVLAEDTRRVRGLLTHFGITAAVRSLHEHNEEREVPRLLAALAGGSDLALVSDAGTPLLADPGFRLVRSCRERGFPVLAVPGASAVTAALAVAGLPPTPFTFAGFLPARGGARAAALAALAGLPHTLVLFLSPHRLAAEILACAAALGEAREAVVLAELTKLHERCVRGTLAELARWAATAEARGEYTLVVGPPPPTRPPEPSHEEAQCAVDEELSRGLDRPQALRAAARRLGVPRRALYALLTRRSGE